MSEPLVTQAQLEGLLRRLRAIEERVGRTEVQERGYYEAGSFTPTLVGSTTPGTFTYTAGVNLVEWTRDGNRVLFNGRLSISAITVAPVGNMSIDGWPFAAVADATLVVAGAADVAWQTNLATAHTQLSGQFSNGSSGMLLIKSGDALTRGPVQGGDIAIVGALAEFRFGGGYRVA